MYFPKLNEEINIPFKNRTYFHFFHMMKYVFKKMLNLGRMNLTYHMIKALHKSFEHYENLINEMSDLFSLDDKMKKNLEAANNKDIENTVGDMSKEQEKKEATMPEEGEGEDSKGDSKG
jgi:hypothetical protein